MECVREKFKNFEGCEMTGLWHDENESSVIVLLSDFNVAESGADKFFEARTTDGGYYFS